MLDQFYTVSLLYEKCKYQTEPMFYVLNYFVFCLGAHHVIIIDTNCYFQVM